jgi:hypothetical protein
MPQTITCAADVPPLSGDYLDFEAADFERLAKNYALGTPRAVLLGQSMLLMRRSNERWALRFEHVRIVDADSDFWGENGGFCHPSVAAANLRREREAQQDEQAQWEHELARQEWEALHPEERCPPRE